MSGSKLYIGPAGWSYPDWRGVVYPHKRPRDFSELGFIAKYFNAVEINSTFYKIPSAASVQRWVEQVKARDDFLFCVKLERQFTHSQAAIDRSMTARFTNILAPFVDQKRLGAVLIQFPWQFKKNGAAVERLLRISDFLRDFPCAFEFRHASWQHDDVLKMLAQRHAAFVNIDQPVIGDSVKPSGAVTASFAYARFHGRNSAAWFAADAGRNERYNYLYSDSELASWASPIKEMSKKTEQVFIIFNNHFRGQALINAFQMMHQMKKEKPPAPEMLLRFYPQAEKFAVADLSGRTMQLF